jgi:Leucine-rich repeat (LRR) protein
MERLDIKKNGQYSKSYGKNIPIGDKSLVQSGHAEIESNKILYIYGNALEVLSRSEFYDVVEEMHLTFVRFDLIVYHPNLDKLRKFKKLKKLVLSHNNLNSFILLSKIECIHSLNSLYIYDNEVLNARTLKSFVVYRFQHINEFNGLPIVDGDKKIAKQEFQIFDKILSI